MLGRGRIGGGGRAARGPAVKARREGAIAEKPRAEAAYRPTSFDIAYQAGVSQPTVSRALRGDRTVSAETRQRIEEIARRLNYKVDKNASNLRCKHSNTLAVLLFEDPTPDQSSINPFFLSMLGSITRSCALRGYDMLVSFQHLGSNWRCDYEDSRKADGLILLGYGDYVAYRARLEQLVEQRTRFVRWGAVQEGQPGLSIGSDNFGGCFDATAHLLAHGRRQIAFLGMADSHAPEFFERYQGFTSALTEAGIKPAANIDAISTEQSGYVAARQLLARGIGLDAIIAASDLIAIGAMRALQEAGCDVPGQVAVVGFDDLPAASLVAPALTTVMQDTQRAGEVLVDTLLALVHGKPVESTILPTRLMIRNSCGAGGGLAASRVTRAGR